MMQLPKIAVFTTTNLDEMLNNFPSVQYLASEKRENFSGDFPLHTRYFSNGDRPLVALVNVRGDVRLNYNNNEFIIPEGAFVFFDDSVSHSWIFKNADVEIFFYRHTNTDAPAPCEGDYCLDSAW